MSEPYHCYYVLFMAHLTSTQLSFSSHPLLYTLVINSYVKRKRVDTMLFFKLKYNVETSEPAVNTGDAEEKPKVIISHDTETTCVIATACKKGDLIFYAVTKANDFLPGRELCLQHLHDNNINADFLGTKEITATQFLAALRKDSYRYDCDETIDYVIELFSLGLYEKRRMHALEIKEKMILLPYSFSAAKLAIKSELCSSLILPEFVRIFTNPQKSFVGHPVHYQLFTESTETALQICEILLGSLLYVNRLLSSRYIFCSFDYNFRFDIEKVLQDLTKLYSVSQGSAIVLNFNLPICVDSNSETKFISDIAAAIKNLVAEYGQHVLTVLSFGSDSNEITKDIFQKAFADIMTIELSDAISAGKETHAYLKRLADSYNLSCRHSLYSGLDKTADSFQPKDLKAYFRKWHNDLLQTKYYSQYANLKVVTPEKPVEIVSSLAVLNNMIGLTEPKMVIQQALDYAKAQKLFAEKGLISTRPSMHMVFSGNPGTAKTTVARLYAQIMKENGFLSKGDLIEVGRNDLVARYVGWTAKTVKAKFAEAKGSVLFIDEAYSLLDERAGSFGDEAINTIVQEMENAREDTIVIFAGYPNEMEYFLSSNPGLNSRIAYRINFPDYNEEELFEIVRLMLQEQNLKLDSVAIPRVKNIIAFGCRQENFGNGRYVRNILDKAKMKQASRLVTTDPAVITNENINLLICDDFDAPALANRTVPKTRNSIGFINF